MGRTGKIMVTSVSSFLKRDLNVSALPVSVSTTNFHLWDVCVNTDVAVKGNGNHVAVGRVSSKCLV